MNDLLVFLSQRRATGDAKATHTGMYFPLMGSWHIPENDEHVFSDGVVVQRVVQLPKDMFIALRNMPRSHQWEVHSGVRGPFVTRRFSLTQKY